MKSPADGGGISALQTLYRAIVDTIFPPRCARCLAYVDMQGQWCERCLRLVVDSRKIGIDRQRFRELDAVFVICRYHNGVQKLIGLLKYHQKMSCLPHLQFLLRKIEIVDPCSFDCIVPVPLAADKMRRRGFNQTERIFHPWALQEGILWLDALRRIRETEPQYTLSREARRKNVQGAFQIKETVHVKGKQILLVDDIFTTGTTMNACAKVLKKAGAAKVVGLALAGDG